MKKEELIFKLSRVGLDNEPSKPSLSPQQLEQNKSPPILSESHYCVIDKTPHSRWPGTHSVLVTTAQPPVPRPALTAAHLHSPHSPGGASSKQFLSCGLEPEQCGRVVIALKTQLITTNCCDAILVLIILK